VKIAAGLSSLLLPPWTGFAVFVAYAIATEPSNGTDARTT
jgi:hypothetical protein